MINEVGNFMESEVVYDNKDIVLFLLINIFYLLRRVKI